jgi:hypothetical protein
MTKGLDETVYFVECKDHAAAVGTDIVTTLKAWLDTAKARALGARGMVVARRFSPQAGEFAKSVGIRVFTLDDLERALLDFGPYLNRLVSEFASSPLAASYVEQFVEPEKSPSERLPLLSHATAWADGTGSRLWVLLGDYGTGKTTFTRRFAYDLAQRALGDRRRLCRCWSICATTPTSPASPTCCTSTGQPVPASGATRRYSCICWRAGASCCCSTASMKWASPRRTATSSSSFAASSMPPAARATRRAATASWLPAANSISATSARPKMPSPAAATAWKARRAASTAR